MELGAPSYGFSYRPLIDGSEASSRSINNLNLKMNENDDGITPAAWWTFIGNVASALGIGISSLNAKITETRLYETA